MKKKITHFFLVLLCTLLVSTVKAQPLLRKTFKLPPNVYGSYTGNFNKVIKTSDGGYVFAGIAETGWSYEPEMDGDIFEEPMQSAYLVKTDSAFNQQWGKVYEELQYFRSYTSEEATYTITDLVDNQNGTFSILLHFYFGVMGGPEDAYDRIVTFNNAGTVILDNAPTDFLYNITEEGLRGNKCLLIDPSTNSTIYTDIDDYVGGNMTGEQFTLKTTSTGAFSWATNITNDGATRFFSSYYIPSSGNYLFAGIDSNRDLYVVEITNSGTVVWAKTYGGAGTETVASIIPTTGGYYIAGGTNSSGAGGYDILLQKIDLAGNPVFAKTYGTSGFEIASGITAKGTTVYLTSANRLIQTDLSGNLIQAFTGIGGAICQNDLSATTLVFANGPAQRTDLSGNITGACITTSFTPAVNTFNSNPTSITVTQTALSITPSSTSGGTSGLLTTTENIACSVGLCSITASITAAGPTTFCTGGNVTLNANTGAGFSYQWKLNGSDITGQTGSSYTATTAGNYTCVTSLPCGSATSNSITVSVNTVPTVNITAGGPTDICLGSGSVTLTANAGSSFQWKLNNNNIAGATSQSYVASGSGAYTCEINSTCGTATSNSITVNTVTLPSPTLSASGPTSFCNSGTVTLSMATGPGYTYQWLENSATIAGEVNSSYIASTTGFYQCIITNACGSQLSNSISVMVDSAPSVVLVSNGVSTICSGGSIPFYASYTAGQSYQWQLNGVDIPGQTSFNYNGTVTGTYQCVVTNTCGSATSNSKSIIVESSAVASITSSTTSVCAGGSITLNAATASGYSYQWQLNNVNISGQTSSSYSATATGNYTCVVTNTCGSVSSNTIGITVNAIPNATITAGGPTSFCAGGSVTLNANSGAGLSYQWKLNGGNINGQTSSSYTAGAAGSYTVVVTGAGGCSATSAPQSVTIGVLTAAVTPSGSLSICSGTSTTLSVTSGASYTYQWYRNNVVLSSATASTFTTSTAGTYKCVVNSVNCSATSNNVVITVTNNPAASVTYTTPLSFCSPGSVLLTANTFAGVSYQWENNSVAIPGATSSTYTATAPGQYRVMETANGCSKYSGKVSVTSPGSPATTIFTNDPTTLCAAGTVNMNVNNPIPGYAYQWKNNNINIGGATGTSYAATASGNYTVTATASCGTTTSNAISVNIGAFSAQVTPGSTVTLCTGNTLTLSANTGTGFTYQWMNNGVNIAGETGPTYSATSAGSYSVVITSPCGPSTSTATVVTQTTVISSLTPAGTSTVCSGTSQTFSASTGAGYTYRWYRNNVLLAATTPTYTTSTAGSYKVEVSISGTCALLSNTAVLTVINNPTPTITAGGPTTFCNGDNVTLTANTFAGVTYQWQRNGINIAGATSQSYVATITGTYRANETANGCSKFTAGTAVTTVNCRLDNGNVSDNELPSIELIAYPNPFNDKINIQLNSSDDAAVLIKITDLTGRVISEQSIGANSVYSLGEKMSDGIYFVEAIQKSNIKTIRILKGK